MAIARLVCGGCGAVLTRDDKFCARCGARVDAGAPKQSVELLSSVRCKACGREVAADANFCESCGARLRGATASQQKQKIQKKNAGGESRAKEGHTERFRFEPWQVITGVIVAAIIAFFAYTELTRDQQPRSPVVQQSTPPPAPEMMQQIEQMQRTVDANPADAASLLKLANMLHDAGMNSPMLLNRAINTYSKYLALKPTDPNARVDMGICYFEMARADTNNAATWLSKSIQEMQAAFTSNPTHQPAAFNLGIVNLNAGNLEESNTWFKKAVEIDPNSTLGKKAQQMLEQHSAPGQPN